MPAAIDEILRIHAPLIANRRVTTRPVVVGGRSIPADQRVTLIWASANRDEAVFDEPFRFDVTRNPNHHVAFGYGTHFCLGANLARQTLRILFEELPQRITDLRAVTEPDVEPNLFARAVRSFTLAYRRR